MNNITKESKMSAGQLRERVTAFFSKWRDRAKSGWSDENCNVKVLHIDSEHIDSEHDEYQYAHMILAFQYELDSEKFFADYRLSVTEPQAKLIFYPSRLTGWGEDRSPLVVCYSEIHGKSIQLRPREFDEPGVTYDDLYFVEWLFNEMTTDLGLVPKVPFDFTPIHKYIERQKEVFVQTQLLWAGLYDGWCAIDAAWDNHLLN